MAISNVPEVAHFRRSLTSGSRINFAVLVCQLQAGAKELSYGDRAVKGPWLVTSEHYLRFRPLKWIVPGVYGEITRRCALTSYRQAFQHYLDDFLYDMSYGVRTSQIIPRDALSFPDPETQRYSSRYRATPARVIEGGLQALLEHAPDARELPLVDYGCGAGRVLVTAAHLGFRCLVGIELSPPLLALCRENCEKLRRLPTAPDILVSSENAASYPLPDQARACYMFDPFTGPVLDAAMQRITESLKAHARPFYLVTYYLDQGFLRSHHFHKVDQRWGASLYCYRLEP